ncbi:MAG: HAMP domain-containing histidine kinase [Sphaerochaetaceae bacterium]|nr:HAMP domain-containing histidine kinase [Sphaerochaetaceae bacterium]
MLATLAHEIRTPLTIMQTTENVLMEQIPGPLNPRQKKFMESIYINTQRLITFSENMLTLLKIGQEWKPDLSKTIDLRILTKQVIDMVQPLIQLRSQKIRYSFPSRVARPYADEAWIRQVLVNLIHNASKHTEEGGTIVVSLTQDDEQVVLTVSDNGQGLLGEGRETLFKEFYQEDHDLKTYQDGFGLGLAIVRTVIGRHRGNVYITSSRNLGTMVSFNLPVEAEQ